MKRYIRQWTGRSGWDVITEPKARSIIAVAHDREPYDRAVSESLDRLDEGINFHGEYQVIMPLPTNISTILELAKQFVDVNITMNIGEWPDSDWFGNENFDLNFFVGEEFNTIHVYPVDNGTTNTIDGPVAQFQFSRELFKAK